MASTESIEKADKGRPTAVFQGKNIHSSPVDGKLLCSFSEKTCMQRRLNRYAFCIRHVLEDKNAPFKQCKFVAKYNGQRCTNAIPVKEERIYCNSHLQVLGIVPKKIRKKKGHVESNQAVSTSKRSSSKAPRPHTETIQARSFQNLISKRSERATSCVSTPKLSADKRNLRKAEVLRANPLLGELVNTYSQARNSKRDLFHYYGLCSSSDDESEHDGSEDNCSQETTNFCCPVSYDPECHTDSPRTAKLWELRKRLRAELLGVRKSISAHKKDVKQSAPALNLLMTSIKASPSLTAVAIQSDNNTVLPGSRKRSAQHGTNSVICAASVKENVKCKRTAIPYTKYCSQHIINDSKQLLFHRCSVEFSANSQCSVPTLDLLHDKPLCKHHINSQVTYKPSSTKVQPKTPVIAQPVTVAPQKPPAKKARRKPQARAVPTQKSTKASKKASRKDTQKTPRVEKNSKKAAASLGSFPVTPTIPESVNHMNFEKPSEHFALSGVVSQPQNNIDFIPNGSLKMEPLCPKNDLDMFSSGEFKEPGMFDAHDMDVESSLENDDLNMPEDLGDISPTGILRDSVLKLPLELSESGVTLPVKQSAPQSPVDAFSINRSVCDGNLVKTIITSSRAETSKQANPMTNKLKQYDVPPLRVNQINVLPPGTRPSRTSVITLPRFPQNSSSLGQNVSPRYSLPTLPDQYTSFAPIGPATIKTEGVMRKADNRPSLEMNHGHATLYPLQFDTVLNSAVAWGNGTQKFVLNNRARPLLVNAPMMNSVMNNSATYSPSATISPHISPQITLGTAFNFDRPSVLQHSNSSSPTLSPFSATLHPNPPHGKLLPRTIRLESRSTNPNDLDPFFGASFDKP